MSRIVVLGGGVVGLSTAMMLAQQGHDVTVVERDGEPLPASPDDAWCAWERRGVAQFRQPHFLQPAGRQILDRHLPEVTESLRRAGGVTFDLSRMLPPSITDRAPRPGDGRFVTVTGRRPTVEYAVEVLHVRHVIVCGHSDCGAIKAMIDRTALERLPLTAKWLGFVESAWRHLDPATPNDPKSLHTGLIHANIIAQYENLKTHPHIARGIQEKTLQVHGWYYDILTGAIEAWQETERKFIPLEQVAEQFAAEPAAS